MNLLEPFFEQPLAVQECIYCGEDTMQWNERRQLMVCTECEECCQYREPFDEEALYDIR
jgi:hypothetical protein